MDKTHHCDGVYPFTRIDEMDTSPSRELFFWILDGALFNYSLRGIRCLFVFAKKRTGEYSNYENWRLHPACWRRAFHTL